MRSNKYKIAIWTITISVLFLALIATMAFTFINNDNRISNADRKILLSDYSHPNPINQLIDLNYDRNKVLLIIQNEPQYINSPGLSGVPPLTYASYVGNLDAIKILIENGAEINSQHSLLKTTALHSAVEASHNPMYPDALKIVELLLVHGADTEIRDRNGNTPLDFCDPSNPAKDLLEDFKNAQQDSIPHS